MLAEITKNPMFGITLTLFSYAVGVMIHEKVKSHIANPILIACTIIILLLLPLGVSYDVYNEGAKYISFLLGPATVSLAVPLYKNIKLIKGNKAAILAGISCGSITGIISASMIAALLGCDKAVCVSLAPKSVTSPIAMEVSRVLGGYPSLTAAVVIITGIIGAMVGPEILKILGVRSRIAKGIAIGAASHGIGTTRAMQEGDDIGAMSSLAMGTAGIITSIAAPFIIGLIF